MKRLLLTITATLALTLHAQQGRLFTTDRELPNSLVHQLAQDQRGYVWMATQGGLVRYDSHHFTTFRSHGTEGSLTSNYVNSVAAPPDGSMLVGSACGLQRFDYATESFVRVPLIYNTERLGDCSVSDIAVLRSGDALVATAGYGVFRLQRGQQEARRIEGFPMGGGVNSMAEDNRGTIWAVSSTDGVASFAPATGRTATYLADRAATLECTVVATGADGTVYVGTHHDGVYTRRPASDVFLPMPGTRGFNVTALLARPDGLLIGSDGQGVLVARDGSVAPAGLYSSETDLATAKVSTLMQDRNGNLWLGLFQKGVFVQPSHESGFRYIGYRSGSHNVIGKACVMAVQQDADGTLWVGTDGDGLYHITTQGQLLRHYPPSLATGMPATVLCIAEDAAGRLWIGSFLQGAGQLDRQTGRFSQLPCTSRGNALHIFDLACGQDGLLWIATLGDGLKCYDTGNGRVKEWRMQAGGTETTDALTNDWVSDITLSRDGKRLYACTSSGLACFDIARQSFTSQWGKNHVLDAVRVQRVFEAPDGTLWVGTDNGLYNMVPGTQGMELMTTDTGLPNDAVSSIEQDDKGHIWISTAHGMACIDPASRAVSSYYASDGLQGNEFSERASTHIGDTLMVFGGNNGLTLFCPGSIAATGTSLKVYLTDFAVGGQPVTKSTRSGRYEIVDTAVADATRFHLAHSDNSVTISLSAMDYASPEGIRYQYSVNDGLWETLPEGISQITLSQLPPGTYHFCVRATRSYGQESAVRRFDIVIHPAWYATVWARIGYALLLVAAVAWYLRRLHKNRQLQLRLQEHVHAEQLDEERAKFERARTQLIENIGNAQPDVESPDERILQRIIACINKNAWNADYSVNMIADEVGLSRVHLYRKMKELTNQTPSEFIGQVRLQKAALLLSSAERKSIEEVAYACGFSSPSTFTRKFKSQYGKTPTDYMREHQS